MQRFCFYISDTMHTHHIVGAGGGATSAARSVANAGRMPLDQARQVLNIESRVPLSAEDVNKNFMKYYEANDPEK